MTRIVEIKGISLNETQRLSQHGITTLDDLWSRIGSSFNEGLEQVAADTGVGRESLFALVVADSLRSVRKRAFPQTIWYYPELILIIPRWCWLRFKTFWLSWKIAWPDLLLIAFTAALISMGFNTWRRFEEYRGRYVMTPLPLGSTSRADQLITVDLANKLKGRQVISLPIKSGTLVPNLTPPTDVWLLLTTRQTGDKGSSSEIIKNVLLLSVERQGEASSITVAVEAGELEKLKSLLGIADVFVLRPLP